MSSPRNPGESFEAYKLRRVVEKREEQRHCRGVMAWVSTEPFEKDGKKYRRTRTFVKPKQRPVPAQ